MKLTWPELQYFIRADLHRYDGGTSLRHWIQAWRFEPGFRVSLLMRLCCFLRARPWFFWTLYPPVRLWFNALSTKHKVLIDPFAEIGPGLYLGHGFSIVINRRVKIGRDFSVGHEVTLGISGRGSQRGCPEVGDRVYIGPGAKVIGPVKLGNDCAIGANAVVTHDVPDNGVAAGVPARLLSLKGSSEYVTNILEPGA